MENSYYRDTREGERLYERQVKSQKQLESFWPWFIAVFKQRCREFCDSRDPQFRAMLQDILRGEDFTLPPIESRIKGYVQSTEVLLTGFAAQGIKTVFWIKTDWQKNMRANTLIALMWKGEDWIREFLSGMDEIYRKIDGGDPEGIFTKVVSPEEKSYLHSQILQQLLNHQYFQIESLRQNPSFWIRYIKDSKFNLSFKPRLEHQWIVAASGAGKTQLLQRMICDDIEHGRSVVVIDSQRDMIGKLIRLKHDMEVVYIDPEDIEYPPGIALFDITFGTGAEAEARETQVIELYEYMFSVFGAELTARQGSLFTYALRLMFAIPKANIHTLVDLFRGDKFQFKRYWEKMDEVECDFFNREFFETKYKANREQILAKLNKILENKTLRRIFLNTESKLDFSTLLNRPVAIFINTSQEQLGENGCALFGRFLLSLITNAIVGRSKMPEEERRPVFLYVDEGRDYGNDDAFERIIYQCRKYKAGLIFCSQNIGQLSQKTVSALFTSSIKFVRAVKEPAETRKLAQSIRVDEDFLHDLDIKDRSHAEWACKIENQKTVKATVKFGYLENQPKITEQEYQQLHERNRQKYCVKAERKPPGDSDDGGTPQAPPDQPKPAGSGQSPEQSGRDDSIWD